jgi:putative radical SAM enzyme (TIGR03279 family)
MGGLIVEKVTSGSAAQEWGLEKGDRIIAINGVGLNDIVDYYYSLDSNCLTVEALKKDGRSLSFTVDREKSSDWGVEFAPIKIRQCNNRCIFCFMEQLPKGMRSSLYVRDDDYRLSFLFGNYLTLTNFRRADFNRIKRQRLSPLYVSVHSTVPETRNFILGNPKAPDILTQLEQLARAGISFHTQIVLCPGINDGLVLEKTLSDLASLYPAVLSVAIIPVGLTTHRSGLYPLKSVDTNYSRNVIDFILPWQKRFRKMLGKTFAYLADEFYLLAGKPFPALSYYDDFPQLENGVGLSLKFIKEFKALRSSLPIEIGIPRKVALITGELALKIIGPIVKELNKIKGLTIELWPVKNYFFGQGITVTGLLTGKDILRVIKAKEDRGYQEILLPSVILDDEQRVFLDDLSLESIHREIETKIRVVEPTAKGLIQSLFYCER